MLAPYLVSAVFFSFFLLSPSILMRNMKLSSGLKSCIECGKFKRYEVRDLKQMLDSSITLQHTWDSFLSTKVRQGCRHVSFCGIVQP